MSPLPLLLVFEVMGWKVLSNHYVTGEYLVDGIPCRQIYICGVQCQYNKLLCPGWCQACVLLGVALIRKAFILLDVPCKWWKDFGMSLVTEYPVSGDRFSCFWKRLMGEFGDGNMLNIKGRRIDSRLLKMAVGRKRQTTPDSCPFPSHGSESIENWAIISELPYFWSCESLMKQQKMDWG